MNPASKPKIFTGVSAPSFPMLLIYTTVMLISNLSAAEG